MRPLPSTWFWCQQHTVKASGRCYTMVWVPKTHGEGKRPLPSPWLRCQQHTVKACGRCLHHGFGAKPHREGKRRLPSTWFWCQQHTVKAKRPLLSPWFLGEKHMVKASGRCLHHGLGAKTHREGMRRLPDLKMYTICDVPSLIGSKFCAKVPPNTPVGSNQYACREQDLR